MYIKDTLKMKSLPPWLTWLILTLFVVGIVMVGLIVYNTHSLSSGAETNETGSVIKPENPPWKDLKPFRGKTKTNGKTGKMTKPSVTGRTIDIE